METEKLLMPAGVKTPEDVLEFRSRSAKEINDRICERFMTDGEFDYKMAGEIFGTDQEILDRIKFVLERFLRPKDPTKAKRKDGSHIATHSLQLFRAASSFYEISDPQVGRAVLVHDLLEDTTTSFEDIARALSEQDARLAQFMTEEDLDEESKVRAGGDAGILSIAKFVHKLKTGGDTIIKAEILDRMDDISDLEYLTKMLSNPETVDKAVRSLEDKFAKCSFTIESLVGDTAEGEIGYLRGQFLELMKFQIIKIEEAFGVQISHEKIDETKSKYIAYHKETEDKSA